MANISFMATQPGDIEFAITITMSLRQWEAVCDDLDAGSKRSESYNIRAAIKDCVRQAGKTYRPAPSEPEGAIK